MQDETNKTGLPAWLRIAIIGRNPRHTLIRATVLGVICFVLFKFVLLHISVNGISMLPTYRDHSLYFFNRFAFLFHEPERGDIVTIRFSGEEYSAKEFFRDLVHVRLAANRLAAPSVMYMKRIVGLPGETVAFRDGHLMINAGEIEEPYVKLPCDWNYTPRKLGPDEFFVVGDNRSMRIEDHDMGVVRRSRIVGKMLL